jgi:hypothetical protein
MPKKKPNMNINRMNKVLREQRLEREKLVGRPRAKTIDSRPDAKKDRKNWRKDVDG